MINFSFNPASLVGIVVALAGAALYALRSVRPELARDYDLFFAALAVLYGFVLLFYSWKYDPLMQFAEIIVGGSAIFFAVENIRMRGITTEQAKRNAPIVDDERPVSRVYRAELDELNPVDERPQTRRIPGSRDSRSARSDDAYGGEGRRRPSRRGGSSERSAPGDRPRRRRSRPEGRLPRQEDLRGDDYGPDDYWADAGDERDDRDDRPSRRRRPRSSNSNIESESGRPRRRRPSQGSPPRGNPVLEDDEPADYVDYQPVDYPDDEAEDNSGDFDY